MTRIRHVGGYIKEKIGGSDTYYAKGDIIYNAQGNINFIADERISFEKPDSPPKVDKYFIKGWWSLDREGQIIIKHAIPKMTVYFHMETKNIPDGHMVYMTLVDEDNSEQEERTKSRKASPDKDDKIELYNTATHKRVYGEKAYRNKVVNKIEFTDYLLNEEFDHTLELYFRVSYRNQNTQYPKDKNDFLKLSKIIVDRYKMPGLNEMGTDISNDLAYGYGIKNGGIIYSSDQVQTFKDEYTRDGFDANKHGLFSGAVSLEDLNGKAVYSKEECYSTKYTIGKIPIINQDVTISTGLDVKIFDKLSTEHLFWDFEATAKLYFAKGALESNLTRMIAKFKRNEGGIYEDNVLTDAIIKSPITTKYCSEVEQYLGKKIKDNIKNLGEVIDKEPDFGKYGDLIKIRNKKGKKFSRPIYNENKSEGLTIALNDIWATEITLFEMEDLGNKKYKAKYNVTLWDHFGLDIEDMQKKFNVIPSVGEAFVTWFILQHLRGYKPFITKISFDKAFEIQL
jgi:hypothetical protein